MKFSLAFLALVAATANGAAIPEGTITSGVQTLTATRVYPSLVTTPPYMITVTTTVVWTQYPVPTSD